MDEDRPLRIAYIGPVPNPHVGGAPGVAGLLFSELCARGATIDCFLPISVESDAADAVAAVRGVTVHTVRSGFAFGKWYSSHPITKMLSAQIATARGRSQAAKAFLECHAETPFDVLYQFSTVEIFGLPRRANLPPIVTWGTSPEDVISVTGAVPNPDEIADENKRTSKWRALDYMGLKPGTPMTEVTLDKVFIGSCTNGRIEDLRAAAAVIKGHKANPRVRTLIVPGSVVVKAQAEKEGLDVIFKEAGFDWREAGCSMCLAMNPDILQPGERCASTSNRNFEGRQGKGGRTHLVSPAMAAAAAVTGHFTDVRRLLEVR